MDFALIPSYGGGDLFDDKFVKNKYFPLMANILKKIES